ncbi:MAG: hypothetical protein U0903_18755 [Planctomycetales bacterium]
MPSPENSPRTDRLLLGIAAFLTLATGVLICGSSIPLGIPKEWVWNRLPLAGDYAWNLPLLLGLAGIIATFVWQGLQRMALAGKLETATWLAGLVLLCFSWLWMTQESAPDPWRLSKGVWVLYFPGPSGYFTEAKTHAQNLPDYLAHYDQTMQQGDVLHLGTHPPGLIVGYRLLMDLTRGSPALCNLIDSTQPESFRLAFQELKRLTERDPNPVTDRDGTVLWGAYLVMQLGAAATIIPLFFLLRTLCSAEISWWTVSLWIFVPALSLFLPKSDAFFPFLSTSILCCWCLAWTKSSPFWSLLSGLITWIGLFCSLAFLPTLFLMTLWTLFQILGTPRSEILSLVKRQFGRTVLPYLCGLVLPILACWLIWKLPLWTVWRWNYLNHAGFYARYHRTYLSWLLLNPFELMIAAGPPLALVAVSAWSLRRGSALHRWGVILPCTLTWGILWLTGKNSGEAARLWIFLIPWGIWLAGESLALRHTALHARNWPRTLWGLWWLQVICCLLVTARVVGFDIPG